MCQRPISIYIPFTECFLSFLQSSYRKGKICCPKCSCKVGAFDFITPSKCDCGKHVQPPVWIVRNRVDVAISLPADIEARIMEGSFRMQDKPISEAKMNTAISICHHNAGYSCQYCAMPMQSEARSAEPLSPSESTFPYRNSMLSVTQLEGHNAHMFDTKCPICRKEFLSAQRNYEFRGPVSHGNHIFDTCCDICRAEFMADQQMATSVIEFQGNTLAGISDTDIRSEVPAAAVQVVSSAQACASHEPHQSSSTLLPETEKLQNNLEIPALAEHAPVTENVHVPVSSTSTIEGGPVEEYGDGVSHANRFALIAQSEDAGDNINAQTEDQVRTPIFIYYCRCFAFMVS